jgi:hypothetical protein
VIVVSETTVNDAAGVEPKLTAVVPEKFEPVIVTAVPPDGGPEDGLTEDTVGSGWTSALNPSSSPALLDPLAASVDPFASAGIQKT